ncbi:hypothetical protein HMPREF3193_01188 [Bifidobacterium breve]|nr:hypothetical protein HMPREF3193_01188 [Bifidobacterium breve]
MARTCVGRRRHSTPYSRTVTVNYRRFGQSDASAYQWCTGDYAFLNFTN